MRPFFIFITLFIVFSLPVIAEKNDTIFFDNDSWYTGQIEDSLFNGFGIMRYSNGTQYTGQWKAGLWNGKGILSFPDGDKYIGSFSNHTINGQGEYFYTNGAKYQGEWENNMFNGTGTMYYADGGYYVGNWQDDKRHGYGVLFSGVDSTMYQGYFYMDAFVGIEPLKEVLESDSQPAESNIPFKNDPLYNSNRNHYFNVGIAFSFKSFLLLSASVEKAKWIWGITASGQLNNPGIGTEARYTDDGGNLIILAGWNEYPADELREGRYTLFTIGFDSGYKFYDSFILCGGLGFGIDMKYINCKCKGGYNSCPYFSIGQLYYKQKTGGLKPSYKLFCKYYIPFSQKYNISLNMGFGNIEGFFVGTGIRF